MRPPPTLSVDGINRMPRDAGRGHRLAARNATGAHPRAPGAPRPRGRAGRLAARSSDEDSRLRLDRLSRAEFGRLARLNRRYRERHHFPCIIALRLHHSRDTVYAEFERRIGNDTGKEIALSLEQIGHVARGRLEALVSGS
jgi:chitin deacetylase